MGLGIPARQRTRVPMGEQKKHGDRRKKNSGAPSSQMNASLNKKRITGKGRRESELWAPCEKVSIWSARSVKYNSKLSQKQTPLVGIVEGQKKADSPRH